MNEGQRLYLYRSTAEEVSLNLAREEYLFDTLPPGSVGFLLYVDSPAVVVGKHQNPWRECSLRLLREWRIPLARRISGGGTVYHDQGNLNFSFILPKTGFDRRANLTIVARALAGLGVEAAITDRHDLFVEGRKISGNAFCFRRDRALHHGTLLVHSDLASLRGLLAGMPGIDTFAVESNPAPVGNLVEFRPGLDLDRVASALCEEMSRTMQAAGSGPPAFIEEEALECAEVETLAARNRTDEWLYERTPRFTVAFEPPAGTLAGERAGEQSAVRLTVEAGRIAGDPPASWGDTPTPDALLSRLLAGVRFDSADIARALVREAGFASLARWFREQGF